MSLAQWALWGVCLALLGALVVLSRGPVRLLFAVGFVADVVAKAGHVFVLSDAPKPLSVAWITGALSWPERAAYHVDVMLVSLWPFGCCALAWWAFLGPQKAEGPDRSEPSSSSPASDGDQKHTARVARPDSPALSAGHRQGAVSVRIGSHAVKVIFAAWLIFSAAMAVLFPLPRGWTQTILHAVYLGCAALSALALMLGWPRRREPDAVVASWLFAGQAAVSIVGPFVRAPWEPGGWDVARVGYITLFSLLLVRFVRLRPRR